MKNTLILISAFMVLAITTPVSGGVAGWSDYAAVTELTPMEQQSYRFRLKLAESPAGCKDPDTFFQDYDRSGSGRIFDVLLQVLIHNKKVRVHVTGRCELNGYTEISSVSIAP